MFLAIHYLCGASIEWYSVTFCTKSVFLVNSVPSRDKRFKRLLLICYVLMDCIPVQVPVRGSRWISQTCAQAGLAITVIKKVFFLLTLFIVLFSSDVSAVRWISDLMLGSVLLSKRIWGIFSGFKCWNWISPIGLQENKDDYMWCVTFPSFSSYTANL